MKNRLGNRRILPALCLAATGTLVLTACGAPASRVTRSRPEPSGELSILIGSSGDAETKAVQTPWPPGPRRAA